MNYTAGLKYFSQEEIDSSRKNDDGCRLDETRNTERKAIFPGFSLQDMIIALNSADACLWKWDWVTNQIEITQSGIELVKLLNFTGTIPLDTWLNMIHPEDLTYVKSAWQFLRKRKKFTLEYRIKSLVGEWLWLETSGSICERKPDGSPRKIIGMHRNISYQKQYSEYIRQSGKMIALGTFAGGLSHDFNNLLQSIIGYTELGLVFFKDEEKIKRYLQEVKDAGMKAKELIAQLQSFIYPSDSIAQPFEFHIILNQTMKMLRSSIPGTISVNLRIDKSIGLLFADPVGVQQVISELVRNACDAMSGQTGTLDITLKKFTMDTVADKSVLPPGTYFHLQFRDTGKGMHSKELERIFDPYYTTKSGKKHTGMGLTLVQRIIRDAGGIIRCESEFGKGAVFDIFFPVYHKKNSEGHSDSASRFQGTERVLIVDDEVIVLQFLKESLKNLGYNVTVFTNGFEALKAFKYAPDQFDIAVIDQVMPGMTGNELAGRMSEIRKDFPIIICTGYGELQFHESLSESGITDFLLKPVKYLDLAGMLRQHLDHKKQRKDDLWKQKS